MPDPALDQTLGFLVADVSRLLRARFDEALAAAGLPVTPGEARALAHVARSGEIAQATLAATLNVSAMTIVAYVDRLEALGLVERVRHPTDRRSNILRLLPSGRRVLADVLKVTDRVRTEAFEALPPGEIEAARLTLARMRDALVGGGRKA